MIKPISAPLHMTINITGTCDLDCIYCYAQPFNLQSIPIEKLITILDEARALGIFVIKIAGGEPLLHPKFSMLLDYIVKNKLPIAILTNLTAKERIIRKLAKVGRENRYISIQASLDSVDEPINAQTRGKCEVVKKNINIMLEHEIDLQIACVVTKHNLNSALDIIDFYYPRIRKFHFMNLMPTLKIRAANNFFDLAPSPIELRKFWASVSKRKSELGSDIQLTEEQGSKITNGCSQECQYQGCSAGITFCEIDSNLDILACNISKSFVMGNLKDSSFEEIWHSKKAEAIRSIPVPLCHTYLMNNSPFLHLESINKRSFTRE